ncbi:hypothetical protein [Pseudonocardia alni]|uniref:hypothetical protein n=1 Tax=Pseudonocardia alni TaxID=33907 RepID=UPI00332BEC71
MSAGEVTDAVRAVLADGDPLRATTAWSPTACERCGADDGDPVVELLDPATNGTSTVHPDCGDAAGLVPVPGGAP